MKWYDTNKTPKTGVPIVFVVGSEEIEGWYIFHWDKKEYLFVRSRTGSTGGWITYKSEEVVKWRDFGVIREHAL